MATAEAFLAAEPGAAHFDGRGAGAGAGTLAVVWNTGRCGSTLLGKALLATGRPRQDGFLLLALALEARARQLGKLPPQTEEGRRRNRALLELDGGA